MKPRCRFCSSELNTTFVNLGMSPLSNAYLKEEQLRHKENFYPLHSYVCDHCFLVQLEEFESPETIFSEYAYFSSFSSSWLAHAKTYTNRMVERFKLNNSSKVIEIASNDGYLLQYFKEYDIPVLGIEPAKNVADVAIQKGIPTLTEFFGVQLAKELKRNCIKADLLLGNNVLAHVPDINDFVGGMKYVIKPEGVITMEFPHLLNLIVQNQFDTIYHEHFSYLSFTTVKKIFEYHKLKLFDVEKLQTHGGSIRIFACNEANSSNKVMPSVESLIDEEKSFGIDDIKTYISFSEKVKDCKIGLWNFLVRARKEHKKVVGYGAPAKGNTLLNYCGIYEDLLEYTVDRSPYKQNHYLPGTHIPIKSPNVIKDTKPDYVLILPWNLKNEIAEQMSYIREWGGKFVVPIPEVEVF